MTKNLHIQLLCSYTSQQIKGSVQSDNVISKFS